MSTPADNLRRHAPLWEPPRTPARWVIWHTGEDSMVFDTKLNIPAPVDDEVLGEVVRRMRAAGAPESSEYPGRPCG
ncbi:hypothetical protein ABZ208_05665 [Streptomyces sp. NPDC006208]|uniref:hypothetical protein n=1 Tax=unclassified Streptomyces TaxID=2593676 RepID=UPI0033B9EBD0